MVGVERRSKEGEILNVAKGLVCSDDFSQYVAKLVTYSKNDLRATLEYIQSHRLTTSAWQHSAGEQ